MLHIVNRSPADSNALSSCLRVIQPGAAILLIEDGVLAAVAGSDTGSQIVQIAHSCPVYALEADCKARGLTNRLPEQVQLIDYHGFVELTERYPKTQSWY